MIRMPKAGVSCLQPALCLIGAVLWQRTFLFLFVLSFLFKFFCVYLSRINITLVYRLIIFLNDNPDYHYKAKVSLFITLLRRNYQTRHHGFLHTRSQRHRKYLLFFIIIVFHHCACNTAECNSSN